MKEFPLHSSELEKTINYSFRNKKILAKALTHSSYSHEMKAHNIEIECNERLEFLGDSVLSVIVSEYLYNNFEHLPEGNLTKIRASVVCERALAKFAGKINLGWYLRLGNGEEHNNGRNRKSILADAFEALIAAVFLDSEENGMDNVKNYVLPFIKEELSSMNIGGVLFDYKTALQQIVQQAEGEILEYVLVSESGPPHMRKFEVEARLNSNIIGRGSGRSKREAEQNAAKEAVELFGELE